MNFGRRETGGGHSLSCAKSGENGPFCGSDIDPVFVPATKGICHCFLSGGVQPLRKQPVPLGVLVVISSLLIRRIRADSWLLFFSNQRFRIVAPLQGF